MTDWTPGVKANATRIRGALQAMFDTPGKELVRREASLWFRAYGKQRPATMWGGGPDAELFVHDGLRPIAIDNGSVTALLSHRLGFSVTKKRLFRAMAVSGDLLGYETRTGQFEEQLLGADSAFIDPLGHWSESLYLSLAACRAAGIGVVVVQMLAARAPLGKPRKDDWVIAYKALVKASLGYATGHVREYRTAGDQRMIVFFCVNRQEGVIGKHVKGRGVRQMHNEYAAIREAWRRMDPSFEAVREKRRAYLKSYRARDPEKDRSKVRLWRAANVEKARAASRNWYHRHKDEPERRAERKAYRRRWYIEHRDELIAKAAEYRQLNRAERLAAKVRPVLPDDARQGESRVTEGLPEAA